MRTIVLTVFSSIFLKYIGISWWSSELCRKTFWDFCSGILQAKCPVSKQWKAIYVLQLHKQNKVYSYCFVDAAKYSSVAEHVYEGHPCWVWNRSVWLSRSV